MAEFKTLGFAAVSWIEHYLVHGPGDVQGQPVELDDEFAAFILKAYRVHPRTGARVVRRAFLSRSKGRSKSGLAAFIECFEALGPCRFDHWAEAGEVSAWGYEYDEGEPVGRPLTYVEILNVATEESQAGNTYDAVFYVLHPETCSPELLADYGRLDVGLTRINLPGRRGYIEPVTASNESKDGGKSTFIVADETHLWVPPANGKFKLGKMHQTMVRNLLKRKIASGWMLETSTMYAEGENSVAEGTHAFAKALAASGRDDGKLLFDHRQASESWDISKRGERIKALREAYGPAASWMDLQSIADYYDDPQASEAEFRRFWLNQSVPTVEPPAHPLPRWSQQRVDATGGRVLAIGLGVSLDRSHGSIGGCLGLADDRKVLGVVDRRPGSRWMVAEAGRLQGLYDCDVVVAGIGPAGSLAADLEAAGIRHTIADTADLCDAAAALYDGISEGTVWQAGHDELDAAAAGAKQKSVGDGRWMWGRRASVSDVSMLEAANLAFWGARESIYEDRGLVTL